MDLLFLDWGVAQQTNYNKFQWSTFCTTILTEKFRFISKLVRLQLNQLIWSEINNQYMDISVSMIQINANQQIQRQTA